MNIKVFLPLILLFAENLLKLTGVPRSQREMGMAAVRGIVLGDVPESVCKPLRRALFSLSNHLKDCKLTAIEMRGIADKFKAERDDT